MFRLQIAPWAGLVGHICDVWSPKSSGVQWFLSIVGSWWFFEETLYCFCSWGWSCVSVHCVGCVCIWYRFTSLMIRNLSGGILAGIEHGNVIYAALKPFSRWMQVEPILCECPALVNRRCFNFRKYYHIEEDLWHWMKGIIMWCIRYSISGSQRQNWIKSPYE